MFKLTSQIKCKMQNEKTMWFLWKWLNINNQWCWSYKILQCTNEILWIYIFKIVTNCLESVLQQCYCGFNSIITKFNWKINQWINQSIRSCVNQHFWINHLNNESLVKTIACRNWHKNVTWRTDWQSAWKEHNNELSHIINSKNSQCCYFSLGTTYAWLIICKERNTLFYTV